MWTSVRSVVLREVLREKREKLCYNSALLIIQEANRTDKNKKMQSIYFDFWLQCTSHKYYKTWWAVQRPVTLHTTERLSGPGRKGHGSVSTCEGWRPRSHCYGALPSLRSALKNTSRRWRVACTRRSGAKGLSEEVDMSSKRMTTELSVLVCVHASIDLPDFPRNLLERMIMQCYLFYYVCLLMPSRGELLDIIW